MQPVSVVVPTRNSAATITACLTSIQAVLPDDGSEIVVVDCQSTDGSERLVRDLMVRLTTVANCFVAQSRNVGVGLTRQPIIAFVDSDCTVDESWYRAIQDTLQAEDAGIVGSRYSLRADPSWVERVWDSAHQLSRSAVVADTVYVPGGNLAIRRAAFDAVGGFDEDLETGEDMDLCARVRLAGRRVLDHRGMTCVHLGEPRTLAAVYRRNRWHGRGALPRYSDGRLAPVFLATVGFAASTVMAAVAVVVGAARGAPPVSWWLLAAPMVVPAVYAWRYARAPLPVHFPQLFAVYCAYFCGRARALPTVAAHLLRARVAK